MINFRPALEPSTKALLYAVQLKMQFPSGFRAVDEGTPVRCTVEDANDQLSDKGIQKLPELGTSSPKGRG